MDSIERLAERMTSNRRTKLGDAGFLAMRLVAGGLMAGHGAQKLFGSFGGNGLKGTADWLESLGMKPGSTWAPLAGMSEMAGGLLTAAGLGGPLGPIATAGAMTMATRRKHWGKPIWTGKGGAELPLMYTAVGIAVALGGPGRYSLDRLLRLHVPKRLSLLAVAGVVGTLVIAERQVAMAQQEAAGEDRLLDQRPREEIEVEEALIEEFEEPGYLAGEGVEAASDDLG